MSITVHGLEFSEVTLADMGEAVDALLVQFCHLMPRLDPPHRRVAERVVLARIIGSRALHLFEHGTEDAEQQAWLDGTAASAAKYLDQLPPAHPRDWSGGFGRP